MEIETAIDDSSGKFSFFSKSNTSPLIANNYRFTDIYNSIKPTIPVSVAICVTKVMYKFLDNEFLVKKLKNDFRNLIIISFEKIFESVKTEKIVSKYVDCSISFFAHENESYRVLYIRVSSKQSFYLIVNEENQYALFNGKDVKQQHKFPIKINELEVSDSPPKKKDENPFRPQWIYRSQFRRFRN